jgi:Uma2 family endonuclease
MKVNAKALTMSVRVCHFCVIYNYDIVEYWQVNLKDNCIEVYLKPQAQDYTLIPIMLQSETIVPSQLPPITVAVSDVLG